MALRCAFMVAVLALCLTRGATAAPITYYYTGGSATVTANTSVTSAVVLEATVLPLDGAFVTFDDATFELLDLCFTIPTSSVLNVSPSAGGYGGYDQFVIDSATIKPGVGYTPIFGVPLGGGVYSYLAGPLDIDGTYSAFDSNGITPTVWYQSAPFTDDSLLNGTLNTNTFTLELNGITLTEFPGAFVGEAEDLVIKADIIFIGAVPEPGTGLLMGMGLVGLAMRSRRATR